MAHFQFDPDIQAAMRLDSLPSKGPLPRWQRKSLQLPGRRGSMDTSMVWSPPPGSAKSINKIRKGEAPSLRKTPNKKTTTKSNQQGKENAGGSSSTTASIPAKPAVKNPGDRFIPNRSLMDLELSQYKVNEAEGEGQGPLSGLLDPTKDNKILVFKQGAPKAAEGFSNNNKVLYSSSKSTGPKTKSKRFIPQSEETILDAPEMRDDFYLTLIDWSSLNILAVALNQEVYLWNANSSSITHLMTLQGEDDYVSSVSWISEGNILAVGNSSGQVQLWDVDSVKCLRNMDGHAGRVGTLDWNYYILSSGSATGKIHHHDVRVAEHHIATLDHHTQQVCGLKWNQDGTYLASGGNDNVLNIWDVSTSTGVEPLHTLTDHQAAVKAVAWCPWQNNLLASGGGTADRMLRLWSANTGTCLKCVDTSSQVSCILWSKEHKELVSGHGFSHNQLTLWKYPSMARIANLRGHTNRILTMCLSPDQEIVVSAAGDESLRFWRCFAQDGKAKTAKSVATGETKRRSLFAASTIR